MDLNELFFRHQISLVRAADAAGVEARHAHRELANGYARRIAQAQAGTREIAGAGIYA